MQTKFKKIQKVKFTFKDLILRNLKNSYYCHQTYLEAFIKYKKVLPSTLIIRLYVYFFLFLFFLGGDEISRRVEQLGLQKYFSELTKYST